MRDARTRQPGPPEPIPNVFGRVPPHDLDVEAAVLSAVMLEPLALDRVLEHLRAEDFYSEAHRRIYEAAVDLHSRSQPVDVVQVGALLKSRERIAQIGGMAYLTEILNAAPAVANVEAYAATVAEKARIRRLIAACQLIAAKGYLDYGDARAFIDSAEQAIYAIAQDAQRSKTTHVLPILKENARVLGELIKGDTYVTGLTTGFDRYDRMTAGLHGGDLTIVAARPGIGKTAYVMNVATNVACGNARGPLEKAGNLGAVWVGSLEMPKEQLTSRMSCSEARIDLTKMRTGLLSPSEWDRYNTANVFLGGLPIWIDDTPAMSLLEVRSKVRRLKAEIDRGARGIGGKPWPPLKLVVLDYLQLMGGSGNKSQNREQEISEISRGLKALAKELDVAVVALSQLNRAVESRPDKRPLLSDLRESGAIEQDADNICFIYRDDYYNADSVEKNIAELLIAKQRSGPTGTVKVRFDREYTRFCNLPDADSDDPS